MNHRAIVLKQYQDKATKLRAELADTETAIRVLGGTVGSGVSSSQAGRNGGGKGKQAKRVRNRSKSAANENLPAALAAELVRIKADAGLSPIQKAQASRKARATYRANATANKAKPEGAVLGEAAAG